MKKYGSEAMLFLAALIWGAGFAMQKVAMDVIGPYTFNFVKLWIAGITLIPIVLIIDKIKKRKVNREDIQTNKEIATNNEIKTLFTGGIACGVALFAASTFQQVGLVYTTAGKAGFITALYIVIVPILGFFIGKKLRLIIAGSVVLATAGLYLLSYTPGSPINIGDVIMLGSALCYAIHILVIDHFASKTEAVKMSMIQFFAAAVLATPVMFIMENPIVSDILEVWFPIFYTGAISAGVAYTLQIIAQKNVEPAVASLILSLESVLAVLAGVIIIGEVVSTKEIIGCVLMFVAIIIAQLPSKEERLNSREKE